MEYDTNLLFEKACDKIYYVELDEEYKNRSLLGLLLNYYGGNIILFTENGIAHIPYHNIKVMLPTKHVSDELKKILNECVKKN